MLEVQDMCITYGTNAEPSVRDINFHVKSGEIVCIVGESGSGKTTLLRALLGCLPENARVSKGDIRLEGESLLSCSPKEWRQLRGTKLSMIFQDSRTTLNPIRRIGAQYVEYICTHEKLSKQDAHTKAVQMLEQMCLPDAERIMRSYPFQLSSGMCQRVNIAMAMTFQPHFLLADEPTSALDVITQAQIVRELMELRENYHTGMIVVTHNPEMAAYMADRILVMQNGCIVDEKQRGGTLGAGTKR